MLPERVPSQRRVPEKPRLKRPEDYPSASNSPFDPIEIDDPDVRQALKRLGILQGGLGQLIIKGLSSSRNE